MEDEPVAGNLLPIKRFQRRLEDFVCAHCGNEVKGHGYTNHCPRCLYSLHVDHNPGDRANNCGGLMRPIGLELKRDDYIIVSRCEKCGAIKRNKAAVDDTREDLIRLSKLPVK